MTEAADRERLWTLRAMRSDERWAESRRLAAAALAALGHSPGRPTFAGITWVPGSD